MEKSRLQIFTTGILKENPVLVLLLGTCPSLAVTTMAINGLGMGVAATVVLVCSNVAISLLKNIIPDKVRIPCYIVLIAGFVTIVQFLVKAYFPGIDSALGLFLPLIVVNCIILGRAEMFASKNSVLNSFLDGLGMGLGFTFALLIMGSIREILGSGTLFAMEEGFEGLRIIPESIDSMALFMLAPGGFFVYGVVIAAVNRLTRGKAIKRRQMGCDGCPAASACGGGGCGKGEE